MKPSYSFCRLFRALGAWENARKAAAERMRLARRMFRINSAQSIRYAAQAGEWKQLAFEWFEQAELAFKS
jgi:hypothetical protein